MGSRYCSGLIDLHLSTTTSYKNYISIPDPFKSEMRSMGRIVEGVWFPARPGELANSTAPATGKEFDALSVIRRQGDNTGVAALGDFDEVIPDQILNRGKLKSGSSRSAGTQPVTRPQRFPPFSRKSRANLLHIKAKR